jgi:hypothetical protein
VVGGGQIYVVARRQPALGKITLVKALADDPSPGGVILARSRTSSITSSNDLHSSRRIEDSLAPTDIK